MQPIDVAAGCLSALLTEIAGYQDTIHSEQDTRLKVINRILTEVLGWPLESITTEEQAGKGYIDYKLSIGGRARLIVEAKRDGRELGLAGRGAGRDYKLNGAVFATEAVKEGIDQGIRYCGQKNAELACITNGREWVVFRGSRLGDGLDTMEGVGFVFPSLEDVRTHFARFYDLLSCEAVTEFRYRAEFQEAEGRPIRAHLFRRALRDKHARRPLTAGKLSNDLDRVMTSFFRRLSGDDDPDFLAHSFVVTRESQIADQRLARISEDLLGRIRTLDTASGDQLTALVERVTMTQRHEFVLLVGTKGAGKSTFIDRFFRLVLPEHLRAECIIARVNVADSSGNETGIETWIDQRLIEELEAAIFGEEGPTFDELQGVFFDEYQRLSTGPWRPVYTRDKEQFKVDFGRHVERRREERPHEYIQRLVKDIVRSRRKVPCLVFDNADHFTIEFQERVFQYARSIYESALCLVILPITDRTSWQLSREGALRSFENEALFLPTPLPRTVLQKRIEYLDLKLRDERRQPGHGYFIKRGIGLSIENLTAFTAALQAIFLRAAEVSTWIGNLANNDIRQSLEIARAVVTSPHLSVDELITAYLTGKRPAGAPHRTTQSQNKRRRHPHVATELDIPLYKVKRALIRGRYHIYPGEPNRYVRNIFAMEDEIETSPLLGLRLLQLLEDAGQSDSNDPFVTVEQIVEYSRAMLVDSHVTLAWLSRMLNAGLCRSYDPTVTDINNVVKVELSPAGFQHIRWGLRDVDYMQAMLEVTPLVDQVMYERLQRLSQEPAKVVWQDKLRCFVEYLIAEDAKYCRVPPEHQAYSAQRRLGMELQGMVRGSSAARGGARGQATRPREVSSDKFRRGPRRPRTAQARLGDRGRSRYR